MNPFKISGLALALSLGLASNVFAAPAGYEELDPASSAVTTESTAPAVEKYSVRRGASLRATLDEWAAGAGWQPVTWKLPEDTDFTLGANAEFTGDFVTATHSFINALGPEAALRVTFNRGNLLMVVEPTK